MVKRESELRLLGVMLTLALMVFISVLLTLSIGLGKAGFDEGRIRDLFSFFGLIAIGSALMIFIFAFAMSRITKGDRKYGDSLVFASFGERPAYFFDVKEKGSTISFIGKFLKRSFQVFLLSWIIFAVLGLFAASQGQTFTGSTSLVLEQQFTPASELAFKSFLIPSSENLGAAAISAMMIFFWTLVARRYNVKRTTYMIVVVFLVLTTFVMYGNINHNLRYGDSDLNINIVRMTWFVFGALTLLTGSFIPAWVAHQANNLFVEAFALFSSDVVQGFSVAGIVIAIILYFILFGLPLITRKNKKGEE